MTGISLDRQRDFGRLPEDQRAPGTRGLLHDLGHQMMTMSLLTESVRADTSLTAESRRRVELVQQEMFRAMDMITDHIPADRPAGTLSEPEPVEIRELAGEVAGLAQAAYGCEVRLQAGPSVTVLTCPTMLWRVLTNLVDNAARAAGPDGRVDISIRQAIDTVIDVVDDGPGFGLGASGLAGLGLSVVHELLADADGRLEVESRPGGGTRARVVLCLEREYEMVPAGTGTWH
jgi:signal transduction histidine kinase